MTSPAGGRRAGGRWGDLALPVWPLLFALAAVPARCDDEGGRKPFPDSVSPVADHRPAPPGPGRAWIVRKQLTPDEDDEIVEIQVSLAMRGFADLQTRVAAGGRIPDDEMNATYLPLAADYDRVAGWLESGGLTVTLRDPNRLAVFAAGRIRDVANVLQVDFGRVETDEGQFTSAVSAPSVPSPVGACILGINGLQPHVHPRKHGVFRLLSTASTTGNGPPFLPAQIALAYHANALSATGAGQKIGIVIDTYPTTSDLTTFWSVCGVPQSLGNIEFVQVVSGTLPAASGEETLDVEWASATAAGAKVRVYATKTLSFVNLGKAYQRIITDASGDAALRQVSLSFGLGEQYSSATQANTDAQYFASMANLGITVFVSSGDGGSSPGTGGHDHTGPVQAESPASDPSVTAVGGTSLDVDSTTGATTSESAWYGSGGGTSIYFSRPSWQTGNGVPTGTTRLVPDVALAADSATGGFLVYNGQAYIVGGTSWSAPTWAGFCALINQVRTGNGAGTLGLLGPRIYPLLGSGSFVDVTAGSNGPGGVYNAGSGYDLCTGIGVPHVGNLLQAEAGGGGDVPALPSWATLALAALLAAAAVPLLRRPKRT